MVQRHSAKGPFWGCTTYPTCTGTRSIADAPAPAKVQATPRPEVPGPAGALLTDLRSASGHIGHAIDILRRRQAEIDQLMDVRDEIPF